MTPQHTKLFTIGRRCGRLANRLILFANFIALAEEQGHRLINYTFHSYSGLFEATRDNFHCAYPVPSRISWLDRIPGLGAVLRRTRVATLFPNEKSLERLVSALLSEVSDEWESSNSFLNMKN